MGPGLITGASDDDPSGVATYSQAVPGSASAWLHAGPTWVWALIAGVVITALVIMGSFTEIARVFKIICLALLS